MDTNNKLPPGFDNPVASPEDEVAQKNWQHRNRDWWENNPMRYDWNSRLKAEEFSEEFYREIDWRHFEDARCYCPWLNKPFDRFIPYENLGNMDVLEIGVGNGSHAQLLASSSKSYTGIDLTSYAVKSTAKRLKLFGIQGNIIQMDAEKLEFPDNSFDFIWTWGVIHHSSNSACVLKEIHRVLRHGGCAITMVYHRSFFYYYIFNGIFRGLLSGQFLKQPNLHKLVQMNTDGAIARFYSIDEWRNLVSNNFEIDEIVIMGQKSELLPLPNSKLKSWIMSIIPDKAARFILGYMHQGSFLLTKLRKI